MALDLELRSAECSLLLFVGVADRLHPFGVHAEWLNAGTLDLPQLAGGAVARSQASTSSHKSADVLETSLCFDTSEKWGAQQIPGQTNSSPRTTCAMSFGPGPSLRRAALTQM